MRIYRTVVNTVEMSGRTGLSRRFWCRSMVVINVIVQKSGSDGFAKIAGRTLPGTCDDARTTVAR
jgi:hypothetical protein